jgi:hypothetical protein
MQTMLWSGCFGNPCPRISLTSFSEAPGILSIREAALRSGIVSKSQTMTVCSVMSLSLAQGGVFLLVALFAASLVSFGGVARCQASAMR